MLRALWLPEITIRQGQVCKARERGRRRNLSTMCEMEQRATIKSVKLHEMNNLHLLFKILCGKIANFYS